MALPDSLAGKRKGDGMGAGAPNLNEQLLKDMQKKKELNRLNSKIAAGEMA